MSQPKGRYQDHHARRLRLALKISLQSRTNYATLTILGYRTTDYWTMLPPTSTARLGHMQDYYDAVGHSGPISRPPLRPSSARSYPATSRISLADGRTGRSQSVGRNRSTLPMSGRGTGGTSWSVRWTRVTYPSSVIPGHAICRSHLMGGPYISGTPTSIEIRLPTKRSLTELGFTQIAKCRLNDRLREQER
jgi:hypothetical protein